MEEEMLMQQSMSENPNIEPTHITPELPASNIVTLASHTASLICLPHESTSLSHKACFSPTTSDFNSFQAHCQPTYTIPKTNNSTSLAHTVCAPQQMISVAGIIKETDIDQDADHTEESSNPSETSDKINRTCLENPQLESKEPIYAKVNKKKLKESASDPPKLSKEQVKSDRTEKKKKSRNTKDIKTSSDKLVSYQISKEDYSALKKTQTDEKISVSEAPTPPPKVNRRSRSSSVNKSRPSSLIESTSTASIASETSASVSGRNSSLEGSVSSTISSPPPGRARPPVLRNFQLSTFTGQIQEQKSKYLPPPRIRKPSDESNKPAAPLRKKTRKKAEEENRKSMEEQSLLEENKNKVSFEFKFVGSKGSVQVVGSFNNWNPEDLYSNNNGVWSKYVHLAQGVYFFR